MLFAIYIESLFAGSPHYRAVWLATAKEGCQQSIFVAATYPLSTSWGIPYIDVHVI